MCIAQKLKDLHTKKNINYTFIAKSIGISRQMLYRFMLPENNKEHRNLKKNKIIELENLINKLENL